MTIEEQHNLEVLKKEIDQLKSKAKLKYEIYPSKTLPTTFYQRLVQLIVTAFWMSILVGFMIVAPTLLLLSFIYYPSSRIFVIAYFMWMIFDSKSAIVGRKNNWLRESFRHWTLWDHFRGYFPAQLVKTAHLDPSRRYIIGYHPHGVYAISMFASVVFNRHFKSLFPGIQVITNTLPANFWIPFWRDLCILVGTGSCERRSIKHRLLHGDPGTSMMIALGGADEFKYMAEGTLDLVLMKRKGFVKLALITGSSLVPIIGFGENNLFQKVKHSFLEPLHSLFRLLVKSEAPLFIGRFGTIIPKNVPLVTLVGSPIHVNHAVPHPTKQQIDELHEEYVTKLKELYHSYKDIFDAERKQELRFVA
ncbi:diacylglycerol acyltransferase-domain-containing protein [Globomyces pollinis-pini]|nr:diacylglycerol acyltransferase-domain-containing protein [Globomyces pollinis-pini]